MNMLKILNEELNEKILVIDVESTCWANDQEKGNQVNEVFQIGMAEINGGQIKTIPAILIKPEHSTVSDYCHNLTGITQDILDAEGQKPEDAYAQLKSILSEYSTWASYGTYDYNQLTRMCDLYHIPQVAQINHVNIRAVYAKDILHSDDPQKAPQNPKLALEAQGISFEGHNHDGEDDAKNIARLYLKIKNKDVQIA